MAISPELPWMGSINPSLGNIHQPEPAQLPGLQPRTAEGESVPGHSPALVVPLRLQASLALCFHHLELHSMAPQLSLCADFWAPQIT